MVPVRGTALVVGRAETGKFHFFHLLRFLQEEMKGSPVIGTLAPPNCVCQTSKGRAGTSPVHAMYLKAQLASHKAGRFG